MPKMEHEEEEAAPELETMEIEEETPAPPAAAPHLLGSCFRVPKADEEEEQRLIFFACEASEEHGPMDDAELVQGFTTDHAFELNQWVWLVDKGLAPLLHTPSPSRWRCLPRMDEDDQ